MTIPGKVGDDGIVAMTKWFDMLGSANFTGKISTFSRIPSASFSVVFYHFMRKK